MAKTQAPGTIEIPEVGTFVADAVPDPFDERDLEYRPRLEPLPDRLDQRPQKYVMKQRGNSCTGHALAAVINTVLGRASTNGQAPRVSPYMLYYLARRYDEYEGEADEGSSLRGALKGWFHHGVVLEQRWAHLRRPRDIETDRFVAEARERPLGTFYRVNAFRLDDMQSAVNELNAVCVSALIHEGWIKPCVAERAGETIHVIARRTDSPGLGGHAFAIVGYNEVGFLVQNSWGESWGSGGFATLPYEDWLDSAYDAWVARPGVPKTPFASGRSSTEPTMSGAMATGPGPDLRRLSGHVVNLGNQGRLSASGRFASTPEQVDGIFGHMKRWHDTWVNGGAVDRRHIVLYAHGGLVSEATGLKTADKHLDWWLNNRIYPVYFAWQSGPAETMMDHLVDNTRGKLPAGGLRFDLVEQFDRLVERFARSHVRWMWDEMKENARAASEPIGHDVTIEWPPTTDKVRDGMASVPGGSLTVLRLAEYIQQEGPDNVAVHLVGHSAGSIFLAGLLQRLVEAGIKISSMALLAPAIRVDEFRRDILAHAGSGKAIASCAVFALSDQRELDDTCGAGGVTTYSKSLLYLVSRALERADANGGAETPLAGMEKFFDRPVSGGTLRQVIDAVQGAAIFAASEADPRSRTDARSHGGFDDDSPTMTSVAMRATWARSPGT
jgi:hypothetical protein